MGKTVCKKVRTVHFWDSYAKWYKLWIEHTDYHNRAIEMLTTMVSPGWKVLDIGAGNGILSLPLSVIGCDVTALEPSIGMRNLLYEEAGKRGIDWIRVDDRPWEEVGINCFRGLDLIIASNSLHLMKMDFTEALQKIFKFKPKHVFVVTELGFPEIKLKWKYGDYQMLFAKSYQVEDSFAYHCLSEVIEHWEFKKGRSLHPAEILEIRSTLSFRDGHMWIDDRAYMGMFWWIKR
ncbi:MAG: methyltransferase domain-containing protein [Thermodesulfovibrionales bacterium]|nr:methyltransferase domain-containing protein [Thermodesulfovibrionales bacterium]